MSFDSFSLWERTCIHYVYTRNVLCGHFYAPNMNFYSFIQQQALGLGDLGVHN